MWPDRVSNPGLDKISHFDTAMVPLNMLHVVISECIWSQVSLK